MSRRSPSLEARLWCRRLRLPSQPARSERLCRAVLDRDVPAEVALRDPRSAVAQRARKRGRIMARRALAAALDRIVTDQVLGLEPEADVVARLTLRTDGGPVRVRGVVRACERRVHG